jgi:pyocin large subunit-like protein
MCKSKCLSDARKTTDNMVHSNGADLDQAFVHSLLQDMGTNNLNQWDSPYEPTRRLPENCHLRPPTRMPRKASIKTWL